MIWINSVIGVLSGALLIGLAIWVRHVTIIIRPKIVAPRTEWKLRRAERFEYCGIG
ncbi:hypothetical protein ACU8OR_04490 [Rhizobium leguminosarum]